MTESFKPLSSRSLSRGAQVYLQPETESSRASLQDPATAVMTDLRRVAPVTTERDTLVDAALQKMIHTRVRLLLVTDNACRLLGVITASDLVGEEPVRVAQSEGIARSAISVGQIMTPLERIDVLTMEQVQEARVGDIIETLRAANRQHLLVIECDEHRCDNIRGIFSATQIGRYMGTEIPPEGAAQSFAELARLLQPGGGQ